MEYVGTGSIPTGLIVGQCTMYLAVRWVFRQCRFNCCLSVQTLKVIAMVRVGVRDWVKVLLIGIRC